MKLAIMTRGRVGRQETLKHIPVEYLRDTVLVTPRGENHVHDIGGYGIAQVEAPEHVTNYSQKFQWILDELYPMESKIVIMDDDLWFNRFEGDRLVVIKDKTFNLEMFELMRILLDEIPLVGVHPRMMAQKWKGTDKKFEWNSKVVTIQGFNRALIPRIPKVDYFPILADVFFNCHLLSHGLPNARIVTHFVDWGPSQAPGGCDYRTAVMQKEACEAVAKMYHPYARTVTKTPKTAKWLGASRTDLNVRWKELYAAGLRGEFNGQP